MNYWNTTLNPASRHSQIRLRDTLVEKDKEPWQKRRTILRIISLLSENFLIIIHATHTVPAVDTLWCQSSSVIMQGFITKNSSVRECSCKPSTFYDVSGSLRPQRGRCRPLSLLSIPGPSEAAIEANEGSPQAGGAGIPSLCRWAQSFPPRRSGRSHT